jgi:hypothetical protein
MKMKLQGASSESIEQKTSVETFRASTESVRRLFLALRFFPQERHTNINAQLPV